MAKKVYLISDGYYRDEYPMHTNLDVEKFYSVQSLEQRTTLLDLLGDNLYTALFDYAENELDDKGCNDLSLLLSNVQALLVFYVAKGLEEFNAEANDLRVNAINHKIAFLERIVKDVVENSECLTLLKSDDTQTDRMDYNANPTYFWK